MKKLLIALTLLVSSTVMAQPHFEVGYSEHRARHYIVPFITITSLENETRISEVIVNRGNCKLVSASEQTITHRTHNITGRVPVNMVYGTTIRLPINGKCNVKEVTVITDTLELTYNF